MSLFKVIQLGGSHWAVFVVNANDPNDRKMVSSSFDRRSDAEAEASELNRIAEKQSVKVPFDDILNARRAVIVSGDEDGFDQLEIPRDE